MRFLIYILSVFRIIKGSSIQHLNADPNGDEVNNENVTDDSEDESDDEGVDIRKSLESDDEGITIRKSLEQTSSAEEEIEKDLQSIIENLKKCVENNIIEGNSQRLDNPPNSDEIAGRHSDTDDTLSVFSEHSYSQVQENTRNDSGFVDISDITEEEEEHLESNIETLFERVDNIVGKDTDSLPFEEEYQRILHLLDESHKDMINEQAGKNVFVGKPLIIQILFCRTTN